MPAVPKRRHSSRRQGKRRAKIRLKLPTLVACPQCGHLKLPHRICLECEKKEVRPKKSKKK